MKVIKNINNNVSLCVDSKGKELIAFGKGIGFIKPPYLIPLNQIDRTFYNIKDLNLEGIRDIPTDVMKASIQIVDSVERNIGVTLMSTAALVLADHISFAIQRKHESIQLDLSIHEDIKHLYPKEMKEAANALTIIKTHTGIELHDNEAGSIALHFITSRLHSDNQETEIKNRKMLQDIVEVIEKEMEVSINLDSFNYSRFTTHIYYLFKRVFNEGQIESDNHSMFETLKNGYPKTSACSYKISDLFYKNLGIMLNDEEQMYLILHINRLCCREPSHR